MTDEERADRAADQAQKQANRIKEARIAKINEEMQKAYAEANGIKPLKLSEQMQEELAAFTNHYTVGRIFYGIDDLATFLALAAIMNVVDKHGISFLKAGAEENETYIDDEIQTALKIFENADFHEKLIEWKWLPKDEEPQKADEAGKNAPIAKGENVMLRYLESWTYPLDLANTAIFRGQPGEYMTLNAAGRKDKEKGKQADVFLKYDIESDKNITLTNQLTQFDKRVYLALSNLFIDGQNKVTAAHVYKEMTQNKPNLEKSNNIKQGQIEEIFKSIEKMRKTTLLISNEEEHKLYPQYPLVEGKFNLLEVRYATERVNGSIVDDVIHIVALPPLFDYALKKNQVTTISTDLLKIPHLQAVESNISLHDYLTIRIAQMKRAKETGTNKKATPFRNTILIKTIQGNCGFNSPKLKSSLSGKVEAILDEFKKQKFIKGYKWEEVKIRISL